MALYQTIRNRLHKKPFCTAVIVAAGSSTRMGQDKMMLDLAGIPVLVRTIRAFEACPCIDEIVVVTRGDRLEEIAALRGRYGLYKMTKVLTGGATRVESSLAGVMGADACATLIAIHDGARPLVSREIIETTCAAAQRDQAAAPVVPVKDTIKIIDGSFVRETPPRASVAAVQTPQIFQADLIKAALTNALEKELPVTDDRSAVEALGLRVAVTEGSEDNLKITTPLDVQLAESILRRRTQT